VTNHLSPPRKSPSQLLSCGADLSRSGGSRALDQCSKLVPNSSLRDYNDDVTPFLTRVVLKNYKSIAVSGVDLRALTFLVGPNGSGKSNFLDALRFTSDSLRSSLDNALRERGGIAEVRRRSGGHPTHFGIRLEFQLPLAVGHYALRGQEI
jgi:hypothetical protein